MTNAHSILRSLIIYVVCIPLAVFIGYLLGNPIDVGSFVTLTILLGMLCLPLFMRFHHPLMLLSWNATAVLFFLPGRPPLWFATIAISFVISFSQRILNKELRPIRVPELTRPLILIGLVVLVTAELTGGFGVRSLGGGQYGGRRYFYIFLAIAGYFALAAQRIPRQRAILYVGLFFLGSASGIIGDLFPVLGQTMPFIFWLIPPFELGFGDLGLGVARLPGVAAAAAGIFAFMLAKYGIQGIFQMTRPWRFLAFVLFVVAGLFGGYRSLLIIFIGIFTLQFFLEGLHRTKLFPALILTTMLAAGLALPFTTKLPPTVQRAMAFLPIVPIDPVVRQSAEGSSEWRLRMWKAVLPQVPQYFLLGKGLAISQGEYQFTSDTASAGAISEDQWSSALAGDYHNGPLSVIIPFGIWGMIAWLWFMAAGFRVLYCNYRYGDTTLRIVNAFMLANFTARMLMFWLIVGGFYSDLLYYTGLLGLSVSLNGGVARPTATLPAESPADSIPSVLPRQRPVFSRQGN